MGRQSIAAAQPRVSRVLRVLRPALFVSFFFVLSSAQTTRTVATDTTKNNMKKNNNNNDDDDTCFVTGKPPAHVATSLTARYVPRMQPGDPSCCSPCEAYDVVIHKGVVLLVSQKRTEEPRVRSL